jgi:hypothetical protein
MKDYDDDDDYVKWYAKFQRLVAEYLDTEGNTVESLSDEFDNAVENARSENPDQ